PSFGNFDAGVLSRFARKDVVRIAGKRQDRLFHREIDFRRNSQVSALSLWERVSEGPVRVSGFAEIFVRVSRKSGDPHPALSRTLPEGEGTRLNILLF